MGNKISTNAKTVMVVAGGEWQVPIIRKAKTLGLQVINTNPYPNSPGFDFADVGLLANVLDVQKNLEYARQYRPDAIVTDQSDIAVPTVAQLCEQLNRPGIGLEAADKFTNKVTMRKFCVEHGFPTPAFELCRVLNDAREFVQRHGLPVVIKPPASQSSRGVGKVERVEDIAPAYDLAKSFSRDGVVLIEGYVGGTELTVDGIKVHSRHFCLATSSKTHYSHNPMVANRLVFSRTHPEIDYSALHRQHDTLIEAMGLPFGLTHAEYKYYDGRFYLIEVAARGGGTRISSDIVPLVSGIDNTGLLLRMALGERIETIEPDFQDIVVALEFLHFAPGRVAAVVGAEEATSLPGMVDLGLNIRPGEVISPPEDDRSRHGYVIAHSVNRKALESLLERVHAMIRVKYA